MSVRRQFAKATRQASDATTAAGKDDLITVLWRQVRGVRASTGIEVKLELPGKPPTVAPGEIERLSRAVDAAVADARLRGATSVAVHLRARTGCVTIAVFDDRGGLLLTAAASQ